MENSKQYSKYRSVTLTSIIAVAVMSFGSLALAEKGKNGIDNTDSASLKNELFHSADDLKYFYKGQAFDVKIRPVSLEEINLQLQSDESGEQEQNMSVYWKKHKKAVYRWNLRSEGEMGIINDIVKEVALYAMDAGGKIDPQYMPRVVVGSIEGKERILAFGATYGGEVKFHVDSELRKTGYEGIGTIIVSDYLFWCLKNGVDAHLEAVNGAQFFYESLGFQYGEGVKRPDLKATKEQMDRYPMVMKNKDIQQALKNIFKKNSSKANQCSGAF